MSITMSKADGVTVFTVAADPDSSVPPICQILKNLCCSPVCCSVSESLRRLQGGSLSILGALQILVGSLCIGLGTILMCTVDTLWEIRRIGFPYWLGGLFILFGAACILSERFPSPCLAVINLILSLCGVASAIAGIAVYSTSMAKFGFWFCDNYYWSRHDQLSPAPINGYMRQCLAAKSLLIMAVQGIMSLLIILSALQMCLSISSSVLGIKALRKRQDPEGKGACDADSRFNPLMENDANSMA